MIVAARAPGKLAVLGEYAVLSGAPALVMAVDRECLAEIGPAADGRRRVETRFPVPTRHEAAPWAETGVALVDLVCAALAPAPGSERGAAWHALLDSGAFHAGGTKLGLGSSAAALCAFAGAWALWTVQPAPSLERLVDLHRRFQGGSGSGFDVAAALAGGVIEFRLDAEFRPHFGSVRMPNSVGFASIFTGRSASTPNLVGRYQAWSAERPMDAAEQFSIMKGIAEAACAAVREGDARGLLRSVDDYGAQLERLGAAIGAAIVTAEHRAVGVLARRYGVVYKVSGAGGGDLGLALGDDPDALAAFAREAGKNGYLAVNLHMARRGLTVEERTE